MKSGSFAALLRTSVSPATLDRAISMAVPLKEHIARQVALDLRRSYFRLGHPFGTSTPDVGRNHGQRLHEM